MSLPITSINRNSDARQIYPETLYYGRHVLKALPPNRRLGLPGQTPRQEHCLVYKKMLPDGEPIELSPTPSQKLYNHSPDGFQWGYGGSGPALLALALLLDATSDPEMALAHYQQFKWDKVATWGEKWAITTNEILGWLKEEQRPALLQRLSRN